MPREYSNSQAEAVIVEWLHDDLDKEIMRYTMVNGKTREKVAELVGVSVPTVKRRVDKCLPVIERHLKLN